MTKIKNFRLTARPREIARILKNHAHVQSTPALEASIEQLVKDSKRFIHPAAVYVTLPTASAEKAIPLPIAEKAVAVTFLVVTIGSGIEEERKAAADKQDELAVLMLDALRVETLQQSIQFISRLLQDGAKKEECEVSSAFDVQDAALVPAFTKLLGTSRIGIEVEDASPQIPLWSRVAWMLWTPVARSRRGDSSAKPAKAIARV